MDINRFGKWVVFGQDGRHRLVRCDCGAESRALPYDLRVGKTTMCRACKYEEKRGQKRPDLAVHGLADSPTQWVWSDMKRRCYSPDRRGYENYGGRGIKVCDRWITGEGSSGGFACFLADMGERPSAEHQIDRIDNDGDYTPDNCQWVQRNAQNYNKRNTFRFTAFGKELTVEDAEAMSGIPRRTIWHRINVNKMSPEVAMTKPVRQTKASK
jgi:hypothetical protein